MHGLQLMLHRKIYYKKHVIKPFSFLFYFKWTIIGQTFFFLTQVSRFIDTCQIKIVVFFSPQFSQLRGARAKDSFSAKSVRISYWLFYPMNEYIFAQFSSFNFYISMLKLPKDLSFNTYSSQCHSNNCTVLLQIFIVYYIINIRYQTFDSIYLSFVFLSCPIIIISISQNKILFKLNKEIKGK